MPYPGPQLVRDQDVAPGEPHHGYTDQEEHVFSYALYPHAGDLVAGDVIQAGYEFNVPLRTVETVGHPGAAASRGSLLQVTHGL